MTSRFPRVSSCLAFGLLTLLTASVASAIEYQFDLTADQEVPTPTLGGASPTGHGVVDLDLVAGTVSITGSYTGMTSNVVGSHLHGMAGPGATAGVLVGLNNTGGSAGTFDWTGSLSTADLVGLVAGETYVNLHTANNGPGEIRGQVVDSDVLSFQVELTADQEVPTPNLGGATPSGQATVLVDTSTREVGIFGSYTGMTSDVVGSHLHGLAGPGDTAGVLINLLNTGGTSGDFVGGGVLSESDFAGLLAGQTYLNIHTVNNGPGEIRGQVIPEPTTALGATLLGLAAVLRRR